MTPAELARSMDPETLRDTLQRLAAGFSDAGDTRRRVLAADTAGLVAIACHLNSRRAAGMQVKHGLLPRCPHCNEGQARFTATNLAPKWCGDCPSVAGGAFASRVEVMNHRRHTDRAALRVLPWIVGAALLVLTIDLTMGLHIWQ